MTNIICLNEKYSTTQLLHKIVNDECLTLNEDGKIKEECKWNINNSEFKIQKSKLIGKPDDKFETFLFLPTGENRKGEGGLRTKGYFKKSYEDKPLVSIITVIFNGEKYIEKTIQSVISQTYDNVEYIIIDGGSTDETLDIIKKYEDKIDYWVSEKDKGIYDGMNKGINIASGELINFMNAGDELHNSNTLEILMKEIKHLYYSPHFIYGKTDIYSEDKKYITKLKPLKFSKFFLNFFNNRVVCHQAIFVTRNNLCHFSLDYKIKGDLEWYYNILLIIDKNKIYKSHLTICNYSLGGMSSLNNNLNKKETLNILMKYNGISGTLYYYISLFLSPMLILLKKLICGDRIK